MSVLLNSLGLLLLAASCFFLLPLLNPVRRASLFQPRDLTRPGISPLDGLLIIGIALTFLGLNAIALLGGNGTRAATADGLFFSFVLSLVWAFPALLILLTRPGASLRVTFGIRRKGAWTDFCRGLRYGLAMLLPVCAATLATHCLCSLFGISTPPQSALFSLLSPDIPFVWRLLSALLMCTLVPLAEESAFRGVLLPAFAEVEPSRPLVIWQALFFSLLHLNVAAAPGLFVVGVCLALGYARTGSLLTPVAMHIVLNACAVLFAFTAA